jgi:hypothetical protein
MKSFKILRIECTEVVSKLTFRSSKFKFDTKKELANRHFLRFFCKFIKKEAKNHRKTENLYKNEFVIL